MNAEIFTGVVLIDSQNRIYLIKEDDKNQIGQNRWNLPGGSVDKEEKLTISAVRETFEETGYYSKIKSIVGLYQCSKGKAFWVYVVFGAALSSPNKILVTDPSIKEGRWFTKDEFLNINEDQLIHPDMKLVYEKTI